jgi:hypothetical protein
LSKQTAVEWLVEKLIINEDISNESTYINSLIKKAKEMEKQQMIEFSEQVFRNRYNEVYQSLTKVATDTYNETYK